MTWLAWGLPVAGLVLNLLVFTWIGGRFTARIEAGLQAQASLTVLHEKRLDGHDEQLNDLAHLLISARR